MAHEARMQVNLLFPPYWAFGTPYLAIPSLVGHLEARGVKTRAVDLNVRAVDRLFTAGFMEECVRRIEDRLAREPGAADAGGTPLRQFLVSAEVVAPRLEECKATLRRECLPYRVAPARSVLDHAMEVVSAAFQPARIDRLHYHYRGEPIADLALARRLSEDGASNVFEPLVGQRDVEEALAGNPDLIGVSLTGQHQLVPALGLLRKLRAAAPGLPIVLGGSLTHYLQELALSHPELFEGIDFLVVGEGETALAHLVEALEGRRPMERVENLLFRRGGRFWPGELGHVEDVDALVAPDFRGTPWESYLSPRRVIPYLTSRGCYWDRCSFCSLCATFMNRYRERAVDKVIADLGELARKEKAELWCFTDECFSPPRLRAISRGLLAAGLRLEWDILARFEAPFTDGDFTLARSAGLNWITWGLESASPKVLKRMNKGTAPATAARLLQGAHRAGIWNNVFVIFGHPGETDEDYAETRAFVRANLEAIDSLAYTSFRLEKGSAIFREKDGRALQRTGTAETYFGPMFPFQYLPPLDHGQVARRLHDFEAFVQQLSHLSMLFTEGLAPATLKLILHHFGGKEPLRELVRAQGQYFREIFFGEGWLREERFRPGPSSRYPAHPGDGPDGAVLLAEATGRIVVLNGSGAALLEALAAGATLPEALGGLAGGAEAPAAADLQALFPFVRMLVWRGLLVPAAASSRLRAPEVSSGARPHLPFSPGANVALGPSSSEVPRPTAERT